MNAKSSSLRRSESFFGRIFCSAKNRALRGFGNKCFRNPFRSKSATPLGAICDPLRTNRQHPFRGEGVPSGPQIAQIFLIKPSVICGLINYMAIDSKAENIIRKVTGKLVPVGLTPGSDYVQSLPKVRLKTALHS
jgi:hypothetical protein